MHGEVELCEVIPSAPAAGWDAVFSASGGIAMRQHTQKGEMLAQAVGIPYESANRYKVGILPEGRAVKTRPDDAAGWAPSGEELEALAEFFYVQEESSCFTRCLASYCGCGNLRPLKLHFHVNGVGEVMHVKRPFKLGGHCCCPLKMDVFQGAPIPDGAMGAAIPIGRVREDFDNYCTRCCQMCWKCTSYHAIERALGDGMFEKRYTLRANLACCGSHSNCCGATCCKSDAVFDILDADGCVVANLQKTYAPAGGCMDGALCRMCNLFSNYTLSFPRESTAEERMLILVSMFQIDYQFFEKKGNS